MAATIKSSYFAMERARQLSELAHRMVSAGRVQTTSDAPENAELFSPRPSWKLMFQPDLEYREAAAGLQALMRER